MPHYHFKCQECENSKIMIMNVKDFLAFRRNNDGCDVCNNGKLIQVVSTISGKIQKDKESLIQESKEEARKTIEKINQGDEKTFINIYGDKPNELKK